MNFEHADGNTSAVFSLKYHLFRKIIYRSKTYVKLIVVAYLVFPKSGKTKMSKINNIAAILNKYFKPYEFERFLEK